MAKTSITTDVNLYTTSSWRRLTNKTLVYSGTTQIPYVITKNTSTNAIHVWKGNSASPTSFTEQDTANNPDLSGFEVLVGTACIDSLDNIHIFAIWNDQAMAGTREVRHYVFRTIDHATAGDRDKWHAASEEQVVTIAGDASTTNYISCCADTNDDLHVMYRDMITNMGVEYGTILYNNNIGGSWNATSNEIDGQSNELNVISTPITLAKNSSGTIVPQIAVWRANNTYTYLGNALDATGTWTSHLLSTDSANDQILDIACDSTRDETHVVWTDTTNDDLKIATHTNSSSWTTGWSTTTISTAQNYFSCAIYVDGTDIYVFGHTAETDQKIRLFVDTGAGFSEDAASPLESTASVDYDNVLTHWTTYVNNETSKIGYIFEDLTNTELYYNEFTISTPSGFVHSQGYIIG